MHQTLSNSSERPPLSKPFRKAFLSSASSLLAGSLLVFLCGPCAAAGAEPADSLEFPWPSLEGWTVSNPAQVQIVSDPSTGKKVLEISGHAAGGEVAASIERTFAIDLFDPKELYVLRAKVWAESFPTEYEMYLTEHQGGQATAHLGKAVLQVGTNRQDAEVEIRDINPVVSDVRLTIALLGTGKLWIDDLRIERIPLTARHRELDNLSVPPAFAGSPAAVQITPDRRFLVGGKPFFPIGMWGIDFPREEMMKDLAEYGFNTTGTGHLVLRGPDGVKAFLDQAAASGLKVIGVTRFAFHGAEAEVRKELEDFKTKAESVLQVTKDHPAFFAYDIADEPAWAGNDMKAFAEGASFVRQLDPNHPLFSNQAPRGSIQNFQRWYRFVDLGGSDIYPWWNGDPDRHSDLPNKQISVVGDETAKNLEAVGDGKPVLMTLQAFGWSEGPEARVGANLQGKGYSYPPLDKQRFMVFDAIVNGASGILLYQDGRYNEIDPRVRPMAGELAALHDVLASPTLESGEMALSDPAVKMIQKKTERGDIYAIMVNRSDKALEVPVKLSDAQAVWKSHGVEPASTVAEGGTVSFSPWGVRIFVKEAGQ